jgi:hypothetical protein
MKTNAKLILATLSIGLMTNAWSQTVNETSNEINAQTNITRGSIDNLLQRISDKKVDTQFHATDYLDQTQETQNKIEAALTKFETTLEKDILPQASYWMDQYNAIYKSSTYSKEQKGILLDQRLKNINNQFEKLSVSYQAALKGVYALVPYSAVQNDLVVTPAFGSYDRTSTSRETVKAELVVGGNIVSSIKYDVLLQKQNRGDSQVQVSFTTSKEKITVNTYGRRSGSSVANYISGFDVDNTQSAHKYYFLKLDYNAISKDIVGESLYNDFYSKKLYSAIKGSCKSTICLGLRSGDLINLVVMINKLIDRDITLKLADGSRVYLKALNQNVSLISSLLARVDYPEELPFDI